MVLGVGDVIFAPANKVHAVYNTSDAPVVMLIMLSPLVATTDPERIIATPYETVAGTGSVKGDAKRMAELAEELEIDEFVVGLPLKMDGNHNR